MSFKTSETIAGSAIATSGTFNLSYPVGTNAGSFTTFGHKVWVDKFQKLLGNPSDFTIAFGGSNITVTYLGATSIPSGARLTAQLNILGDDTGVVEDDFTGGDVKRTTGASIITVNLGAPVASDTDGICASQAGTASTAMTLNGAIGTKLDVPRNVVAAWTGTATLTVTGKDEYGKVLVETSASGTSFTGKKAFAEITSVVPSANITSATVGISKVIGLPQFLSGAAYILAELEDGADATAGAVVTGVADAATATTGDVRGTYSPSSTPNGTRVFELVIASPDPKYKGVAQYAG